MGYNWVLAHERGYDEDPDTGERTPVDPDDLQRFRNMRDYGTTNPQRIAELKEARNCDDTRSSFYR